MILRKFMGWEECSFDDYTSCCNQYGYNTESSAKFLKFHLDNGAAFSFMAYRRRGELLGAVCTDNGWIANDYKNPRKQTDGLPLPCYSIIPPFREGVQCLAPFKSRSLSQQCKNFKNVSFNLFSKREAAYARSVNDGFSKKTRYNRNREVKKFIDAGGEFISVSDIGSETLYNAYQQLFAQRRECEVKHDHRVKMFFALHHDDFFGNIAMMNGEPVGVQLLISSTSKLGFFVDFINIGYDTDIKDHSLGTIMMWNNLITANEHAKCQDLPLHFSYGMMSGEYKSMWCKPKKTGRILTLLG
ncbi:GNAT family N-acetyltransferase [Serratia proteamaculans]